MNTSIKIGCYDKKFMSPACIKNLKAFTMSYRLFILDEPFVIKKCAALSILCQNSLISIKAFTHKYTPMSYFKYMVVNQCQIQ